LSKNSNEQQKGYIRAVQKYLEIKNPPTSTDFAVAIQELDTKSSKAVFQVCVEYLFLREETPKFFAEYEECLFSFFNVNEKTRLALWENVVNIFLATGRQGLAEKYGFVPEPAEGGNGGQTMEENRNGSSRRFSISPDTSSPPCGVKPNGLSVRAGMARPRLKSWGLRRSRARASSMSLTCWWK
jgi:hypothetical protein